MGKAFKLLLAAVIIIAGIAVAASRMPAVQDRLFAKALEKSFSSRAAALWDNDGISVFFCGTGSPLPSAKRAQTCTAVFAGGKYFLVDSGTGSWENVQAAGIPGERLAGIFLTHLHSDHIGDIGEADLGSWVAGRPSKLAVYGPLGTERIVNGLNEAFALDHVYRTAHHGKAIAEPRTAGLEAVLFAGDAPIVVYEKDGLTVTAFPVKHDPVKPAVGYRFDYAGRSVVISGDTAYSEALVQASRGADLLIHEAQANHMVARLQEAAAKTGNARVAKIFGDIPTYHTSPEDAARAANEAGADWLLLTHLTPAPDNAVAKSIFMRGVSKVRKSNVKLAEDRLAVRLPPDGGFQFECY
ncbi:MAG TPA: MBL fold metallo-hydrolase [Parvularculaceae bacterium]|nr:MBL fold metallo-hydrolase [Parvularculaceae bacterium]